MIKTALTSGIHCYLRKATSEDAVDIMDLQCQNSFLRQGGDHVATKGGLENIFTLSEIKTLCQKGWIILATTKEPDSLDTEKIIGYIMVQYYKALNDQNSINFFTQNIEGKPALLMQICINAESRRKKIGRSLLSKAIEQGRSLGNDSLMAYAISLNFGIRGFLSYFDARDLRDHPLNPTKKLVLYTHKFN